MAADQSIQPARSGAEHPELDMLEAIHEKNQSMAWQSRADALQGLSKTVSKQRNEILSDDLRRKIRTAIMKERSGDVRGPGDRFRSLIAAEQVGVDFSALKKIQDAAHRQVATTFAGASNRFRYSETVVGSSPDWFASPPPIIWTPLPDPNREKVFRPPFMGSWDRFIQNQATGDGRVIANDSYLDGTSRLGSKIVARNHDASDVDIISVRRETGYLVRFKTLRTGILQVKADLQSLYCHHSVVTEDEFGWSDFNASTRSRLVLAVFWNWEDVDPANETSDQWFVAGISCSGDGESYPGDTTQVQPGQRRIVNLYTTMAIEENVKVWIYVGLADEIWAFLNDVSIDIAIDSSWLLNSLSVRSI
ncbi:hypothetical protein [Rhizobium sp. BE258]|uniref:hypothetical protein n=1 Tax=Rhizobium sp. BE258 TaxID=2817722 RepID=UPI002856FD7A|nr:hypothetical protein [Rhizobium sp. BE258]MDR7145312.1 hypothetical protein [Rhizobium sp. BE258]